MIKTCLIVETGERIEFKINDWIKRNNANVIDIKFTSTTRERNEKWNTYKEEVYTALIIYDTEPKEIHIEATPITMFNEETIEDIGKALRKVINNEG